MQLARKSASHKKEVPIVKRLLAACFAVMIGFALIGSVYAAETTKTETKTENKTNGTTIKKTKKTKKKKKNGEVIEQTTETKKEQKR
jgi:hypothetical protein